MCDTVQCALDALPRRDRRSFLRGLTATAVTAGLVTAAGCAPSSGASGSAPTAVPTAVLTTIGDPAARTRLVLLGTAGGPRITAASRTGISTAIVYGDRYYLVDLGWGVNLRLAQAGLGGPSGSNGILSPVSGIFFTHLHSDHFADWPAIYVTALANMAGRSLPPIQVFGPGDRTSLPQVSSSLRSQPQVVNPEHPGLGITGMTEGLRRAFAADLNDRIRDTGSADPKSLFHVHDVDITGVGEIGPDGIPPRMTEPLPVWEDDAVRVTATLVDHRPTAPSFAYRFDTPDGSIVVSGDTAVCDNLIDLARDADYLVHEVTDPAATDKVLAGIPPEIAAGVRQHILASHTTIEQVGRDVAAPAGAKNLVLTHMSAGTTDEVWRRAQKGYAGSLIVGRDLLQIAVTK